MRSDLDIRHARLSDLAELHALIERAYRGESARAGWTHEADLIAGQRTNKEALTAAINSPDDLLLVALRSGRITACVQLTRIAPETAYIGLLTVDPQQQAGGLGKSVLAHAEREAISHFGAKTTELSVVSQRSELIAFYRRRGYVLTGERRPFPMAVDPPLVLVVLDKRLDENGLSID